MSKPAILPAPAGQTHRTGTLRDVTAGEIEEKLGFAPNVEDDPYKVTVSWAFTVDGEFCAIWDYKGSLDFGQVSTYGPEAALRKVFGDKYL